MNALNVAAKNLPGHWIQGRLSDDNGNRCIIGHVREAMGVLDADLIPAECWPVINLVHQVAAEQFPGRCDTAVVLNDDPDTTVEELVMVLEKAAVRWDEISDLH